MLETLLDYTLLYIVTSFRQRLVEKCWHDLGLVSQLEATVMYFCLALSFTQHLNTYVYIYIQSSQYNSNKLELQTCLDLQDIKQSILGHTELALGCSTPL